MKLRILLVLFILTLFLINQFSTLISHASPSIAHGCAPLIPPPVSGSPLPAPAIPGKLLINEVLSLPGSRWNCSELQSMYSITSDSWVELYNPQSQPFNLYTVHATFDSGSNTMPFYFPLGAVIAAHGYLVLFPFMFSGNPIHANLRLLIGGVIIDQITIPSLTTDQSYARYPDGSNLWQITNTPTIDSSNKTSTLNPVVSSTASSSNRGPVGSRNAAPTPTPTIGAQTVWNGLQFPTPVVIATPVIKPAAVYTSPLSPSVNDGWETPRRILISTLIVALGLMLFWCWRLFTGS